MHTAWSVSGPAQLSVYAIGVARRQADGSGRWLIGDAFTVGKHTVHTRRLMQQGDERQGSPPCQDVPKVRFQVV